MKFLKKFKRDALIYSIVFAGAVGNTVYRITNAESLSSTPAISNSSSSSAEVNLTSEEIDKIINDLKASATSKNIIEKLDEISKRAELSGNTALKEYATSTKEAYEKQSELDSLNSMIEAMKKKNTDINTLDGEIKKILAVTTIVEDLQGAVSDETLLLLESLTEENINDLQELIAEIEELFNLKTIKTFTLKQRSLLDVLILNEIINQGMVSDERLSLAQESLSVSSTILKSYEKEKYTDTEYNKLLTETQAFATSGNKTDAVYAEQVIFLDGIFNMKHAPIMYDGHILAAFDDLFQYIDAQIEYMYKSPTMIITSPNKRLEVSSGQNVAYMNDVAINLPAPILNVEETLYLPIESFAEMYDISYRWIESQKMIVLYNNLNQLKNPNSPNELNRD